MRISDWSSDVCSSDLNHCPGRVRFWVCSFAYWFSMRVEETCSLYYGIPECRAVCAAVAHFGRKPCPCRQLSGQFLRGVAGALDGVGSVKRARSEEHTSELQSLMRISYAVFCLKKKKQ